MEREELSKLVEQTVHETLFQLGISVSDHEAITEFRKDMSYVREWRKSVEAVKSKGLLTAVGVVTAGVLASFVLLIRYMLTGH